MTFTKVDYKNNSTNGITFLGEGALGGKASGLAYINDILISHSDDEEFREFDVSIPKLTVLRSDIFDIFMLQNNLHEIAYSKRTDERIAFAFQKAKLPFEIVGDLKRLCNKTRTPLAVRSSSKLEDALFEPFAGIYATKMTPNNHPDPDHRFRKLIEAIKFIYASTYFKSAKDYMLATKHKIEDEKMSVIIQEVVGSQFYERYYPEISGVARSHNFYSIGRAKPEDGVVNLAFGLGKTIVDGGISWSYSPAYPNIGPPFNSISDMLKQTQLDFWYVNMGSPPAYNPIKETEFLIKRSISTAERDGTLRELVSTFDRTSGKLRMGIAINGPRILNFNPILSLGNIPLNKLIIKLLRVCEKAVKAPVEIEFAVSLHKSGAIKKKHKFGFLQVRPMVVSNFDVKINDNEFDSENVILSAENVLGNGINSDLVDIVYVKPEKFRANFTPKIADELKTINQKIIRENSKYLLIGFGRWGSSDPWLGIPVDWSNISGAKVMVEAMLENMNIELSQGSHFFHNLTSFNVSYFSIPFNSKFKINWEWLNQQMVCNETEFVKHVQLSTPLLVKVDGKTGRGIISKDEKKYD